MSPTGPWVEKVQSPHRPLGPWGSLLKGLSTSEPEVMGERGDGGSTRETPGLHSPKDLRIHHPSLTDAPPLVPSDPGRVTHRSFVLPLALLHPSVASNLGGDVPVSSGKNHCRSSTTGRLDETVGEWVSVGAERPDPSRPTPRT